MNAITRNIPNTITCCNLSAGVLSIICAAHGSEPLWGMPAYAWAWIFIGVAAVADFLDGLAARLLHAYSEVGKELDSLSDLVSFGVAPALVLFYALGATGTQEWSRWLIFLIPVTGALRLARFNTDTRQSDSFIGLPIPANAIFWIGYTSLLYQGTAFLGQWYWFALILIAECWLMISPLKLFSLKFKTWGWKGNQWRWLIIITAACMVTFMGVSGLMWLIVAYVLYGLFATK